MTLKEDLLRIGYLPENLPPPFHTDNIAKYFADNPSGYLSDVKQPLRSAVYNSSKRGISRRTFSAVHPVTAPGSEDTELGVLWSRRCVMERRQFTREFKLEAVRLIKERGVSYAQASEDLGVHPTQHAFPGQGQMKPEQLEIAQLRREVLRLKAERDILKKAAAYFAKEST
jgi:transposase